MYSVYSSSMQHLDIYPFPQRELGHKWTELKQHQNDFRYEDDIYSVKQSLLGTLLKRIDVG